MNQLLSIDTLSNDEREALPYAVYACNQPQSLRSVPILKPTFVWVLEGKKTLSVSSATESKCRAGEFVFLAENPDVAMENIPTERGYKALFMEFDSNDFLGLAGAGESRQPYLIGQVDPVIGACVGQFLEWCRVAPKALWGSRRKELIQVLCQAGYDDIVAMAARPKLSHQVVDIFREDIGARPDINSLCKRLAMSESTLRRKLREEGTGFSELNIHVRLSYGMHLVQTTELPIALISERCGYQSPSRFSEKFKERFGLSPARIRQTHLAV